MRGRSFKVQISGYYTYNSLATTTIYRSTCNSIILGKDTRNKVIVVHTKFPKFIPQGRTKGINGNSRGIFFVYILISSVTMFQDVKKVFLCFEI